jgi:DnaK suppressor protein
MPSPAIRTETELFVIAMQSSDRRAPALPDPSLPPDGPPEQRQDVEERAGAHCPRLQLLLARLEEGYEFHTRQLTQLSARPADPAQALDQDSLTAASRQALTVIAAALRAMAEGRYGTCATCGQPIPMERLEARPEARHCLRCQASAAG